MRDTPARDILPTNWTVDAASGIPTACAHASNRLGVGPLRSESWSTTKPPLADARLSALQPPRSAPVPRGRVWRMSASRCTRAGWRCISSPQSSRSGGRHLNRGCAFMSQLSAAKTAGRASARAGPFRSSLWVCVGGRRAVVSPALIAVLIRMFGGWDGETMHQGRSLRLAYWE